MQNPKGLSATIGILIIASAIVVVGVAIYFVYTNTDTSTVTLGVSIEDRVVVAVGTSASITGTVTSDDASLPIAVVLSAPSSVGAELSAQEVQAGESITLTVQGLTSVEETVSIILTQGTRTMSKDVSVKIYSTDPNVNTQQTNTANQNTNSTGTNINSSPTQTGRYINGDFNIAFTYPDTWGAIETAPLNRLTPTAGNFVYQFFSNLNRYDVPGHVAVTATTANYQPTEWAGTPFWLAGVIDPNGSLAEIEAQIRDAGLVPFKITVETLHQRKVVKMLNYRGLYNQYLDVTYILPVASTTSFTTIFISRSLDILADNETPEVDAIALGPSFVEKLEARTLSEEVLWRYDEFEAVIDSLTFIR